MRTGKIPESVWKRSVLPYITTMTNEIMRQTAGLGNDCVISMQEPERVSFSVDTLLLKGNSIRQNGICRTINNLAAAGMQPVAVLADVLLPTDMEEEQLKTLMQQLMACAESYKTAIAGGNILVLDDVIRPVITLTGIGKSIQSVTKLQSENNLQSKRKLPSSAKLRSEKGVSSSAWCGQKVHPGMDIVISKWIGLEGSVLLLEEALERLQTRFTAPFLEEAKGFVRYLSVVEEAAAAMKSGVGAMHNVSEGGIFGALWEMAEGSGVGLEIDLKKIPLRQHTVEICEALDVNPYGLLSGGCLLMAAENGTVLAEELKKQNISATVIGRATDGKSRILYNDGETRYLERPQQDEWYRFLEKRNRRKEE